MHNSIIKGYYTCYSDQPVDLLESSPKGDSSGEVEVEALNHTENLLRQKQLEESMRLAEEQVQAAIQQAQEIRSQAQVQAAQEQAAIIASAQQQAEQLCQQGYQSGYEQGYQAGLTQNRQDLQGYVSHLDAAVQQWHQERNAFLEQYQQGLQLLALDIAQKVLQKKLEQDDMEMLELVKSAVETVRNGQIVSISLSEQMGGLIAYLEENLATVLPPEQDVRQVQVSAKDLELGSCLIETTDGIIDASIQRQIENIKTCFTQ